jgi:5-(carboxyamino)imidazole ribonucleotide synthase
MLGEAATPLGVDVVVSDPAPDAPAAPTVDEQLVGDFDDADTLRTLAERADYLTVEIELVDPDALERAGDATGTPVHPHPETLRTIRDKLVQNERLAAAGIPVPAFRGVDSVAELRAALDEVGCPAMLKAREGGYDGRGNVPIHDREEAADAIEAIDGPAMVEEFVDFERELAVMGCVGDGERDTFPVTETIHEAEILRETVAPARAPETVRERARAVAREVLDCLSGRGVYGVELFEAADGSVLFNEVAPRPHNSGHWTIEGCHTSQFEQHVRAVTGMPLGTTDQRAPAATANVLGDVPERRAAALSGLDRALSTDGLAVHWYGKREVYRLRKMGHLTLSRSDRDRTELLRAVRDAREPLSFDPE